MKRNYKYGIALLVVAFLGYHSVYFKKLSTVRSSAKTEFDYQEFADSLYFQGMLKSDRAIDLSALLLAIQSDPDEAYQHYGNRLGIGNSAFFMVKCQGELSSMDEDGFLITTSDAGTVRINTKYIFGNALRDASGLVQLTDFKTNAEFNKVSEALNTLIRTQMVPPVLASLKPGDRIEVVGALKMSKKDRKVSDLVVTPSQIIPE